MELQMAEHTFCHVEWAVTDLNRAKSFYGGMFNWKFESFGDDYMMIQTPSDEIGGGLMKQDKISTGSSPRVFVLVEDVQPYLDKVSGLGGKMAFPKTDIPGVGWFGMITDPDGNTIGVFQSSHGGDEPMHSFCHVEWSVSDGARAAGFYNGLFDWKFEPFGDEYQMFRTPSGNVGGGIMEEKSFQPAQSPCVYVEVNSIEPYLEKVKTLGGEVGMPKTEIPGMGWFAILLDHDKNAVGIYEGARKE